MQQGFEISSLIKFLSLAWAAWNTINLLSISGFIYPGAQTIDVIDLL